MGWMLPSTGMWRGEVFAISDCLVLYWTNYRSLQLYLWLHSVSLFCGISIRVIIISHKHLFKYMNFVILYHRIEINFHSFITITSSPLLFHASPDGWAVWGVVMSTRWWVLVDHCVLRNWDRILVRAVKGLISRAGMVSICPLLWQRDVKLQQTTSLVSHDDSL